MAEYIMCQTNSLNEEGEPIVYPHMKLCGMCDMKQFAESIENGTTFTAAEVKGLLDTISSKLAYWIGCPVRCSEKQMLKSPIKLQN